MRESASTDLREPQGSNPLGPPGPELQKLSGGRLLGRFFAATRSRLREVAQRLGVHRLANLAGCPAR